MSELTPPRTGAPQQGRNWIERNWKWFVPVGCLGGLILFAGYIALILFLVFGLMRSSDVYKLAVAKARADQTVREVVGNPLEVGVFVSGNINVNGPSGQADLSIPISGPKGEATIYVVATKSAGQWTFSTLVVEDKRTRQRVDLLGRKAETNKVVDIAG